VSLEPATLRSLVDARLVIEPGIAALAAKCGSDADRAALVELAPQCSASFVEDAERFLQLDVELHALILRMANNPFLERIHGKSGTAGAP